MAGMGFVKRLLGKRGQSTSEYMLVLSVIAIGAMGAWALFTDPQGPVEPMAATLSSNYANGLTNNGGGNGMSVVGN